jgi:hypothetical protein
MRERAVALFSLELDGPRGGIVARIVASRSARQAAPRPTPSTAIQGVRETAHMLTTTEKVLKTFVYLQLQMVPSRVQRNV